MHKKLHIILILLLCACATEGFAQQDAMYSQYMSNMIAVNPAYAGSNEVINATLLARFQWVGIKSGPRTQTFSFHTPTPNRRYGIGVNVTNDRIGYTSQTSLNLSYAFRIKIKEYGVLALGLQGGFNNYRLDISKAYLIDEGDVVPFSYNKSYFMPNVGVGAYFNTDKWYVGISVPHLLVNSIEKDRSKILFTEPGNTAAWVRHYFLIGGAVFEINPDVTLMPSLLLKYVQNAPPEADINFSVILRERFWVGVSYRTLDGIVGIVQYQLTPWLRAGYAYDYPFTKLNNYTSGSHEILLRADIKMKNTPLVSPRYF